MNWFMITLLSFFWAAIGWGATQLQPSKGAGSVDLDYWAVIAVIGAMAVLGFSPSETVIWALLLLVCAIAIARFTYGRRFQHGFWVGLIGGAIAAYLQLAVLARNPELSPESNAWLTELPIEAKTWPNRLYIACATGFTRGLLLALLTWFVALFIGVTKPETTKTEETRITAP